MSHPSHRPSRLLIVLPSWVGDTVMATPTLRRLRTALPGAFIGALCRPGIDRLLDGTDMLDEIHVFRPDGVMAPKRAAGKVRPRRYDTALLLTNSFSTALATRMAFIPRRIGYDRDSRGVLLTDRVEPARNPDGSWKLTPGVDSYWNLASHLLGEPLVDWSVHFPSDCVSVPLALPPDAHLELPLTDADRAGGDALLARAGLGPTDRFALLNPGGNNPAKRWPADRYARLAVHLTEAHGLAVLVNGSPAEGALCAEIAGLARQARGGSPSPHLRSGLLCPGGDGLEQARSASDGMVFSLPELGVTISSLKALCARAALLVTNDTGTRHIAAAFGTALVTLFGPTDPRWTTIPVRAFPARSGANAEAVVVADPSLPASESANDHPERCRIERISFERVRDAADGQLLGA